MSKKRRKQSELERAFQTLWLQVSGPDLEPEYRFDDKRKWRFDFAHPLTQTAIELEGGVWSNGRHTRGKGFIADCEKYNAAGMAGWTVIRFTRDMLDDVDNLYQVKHYINERHNE